jgi:hypothetical protein
MPPEDALLAGLALATGRLTRPLNGLATPVVPLPAVTRAGGIRGRPVARRLVARLHRLITLWAAMASRRARPLSATTVLALAALSLSGSLAVAFTLLVPATLGLATLLRVPTGAALTHSVVVGFVARLRAAGLSR